MPVTEYQQLIPRPQPLSFWTGDVWKAIFALSRRPDVDIAVGRFDWGVGVLRVRRNARPCTALSGAPASWTWQDYCAHREQALKPMGYDALLRWIDGADLNRS
jgi:hypothetical protein